jgi:hypothetical protein
MTVDKRHDGGECGRFNGGSSQGEAGWSRASIMALGPQRPLIEDDEHALLEQVRLAQGDQEVGGSASVLQQLGKSPELLGEAGARLPRPGTAAGRTSNEWDLTGVATAAGANGTRHKSALSDGPQGWLRTHGASGRSAVLANGAGGGNACRGVRMEDQGGWLQEGWLDNAPSEMDEVAVPFEQNGGERLGSRHGSVQRPRGCTFDNASHGLVADDDDDGANLEVVSEGGAEGRREAIDNDDVDEVDVDKATLEMFADMDRILQR